LKRRTPKPRAGHDDEGLKWLIALASLDPRKLGKGRPGDVPNLVYELERWFGTSDHPKLVGQIRNLLRRRALLRRLVRELSALIAAVADRDKHVYRYSDGHVEIDAGRLEKGGGRLVSYRFTDLLDAAMHLAINDLTSSDPALIHRCREQACGKIFLASRRSQLYCSRRCANLQAGRRYREANRTLRAERERERYKSKVRTRMGSRTIKVGRQARGQGNDGRRLGAAAAV
jgi:hypothetical protein